MESEEEKAAFDRVIRHGFFGFVELESFQKVRDEVWEFLKEIFTIRHPDTDVIIAVQRKGSWILEDYFKDNPTSPQILLLSDLSFDFPPEKHLDNRKKVVIFDDSIHRGNTVKGVVNRIADKAPEKVVIVSLLCNEKARSGILTSGSKIDDLISFKNFKSYPEQWIVFLTWELTLLSGLIEKRNPDYPSFSISVTPLSLDYAANLLTGYFKKAYPGSVFHSDESLADFRGATSLTFTLDNCKGFAPPDFSRIMDKQCSKVRTSIIVGDSKTEFHFTPMLNSRFDTDSCLNWKRNKEVCLNMQMENENRTDAICKLCATYGTNLLFREKERVGFRKYLKRKGIEVVDESTYMGEIMRLI